VPVMSSTQAGLETGGRRYGMTRGAHQHMKSNLTSLLELSAI
jgi:hypothetical protein